MGARMLHSISKQEVNLAADGIYTYDLAVNPLSVVFLNIRPLNDTGTLANFQSYLGICDAINKVSIMHRGVAIQSMKGVDAAAMAWFRHGYSPFQGNHNNTNNDRRCVSIALFLGRAGFDPVECFPASPRGELTIELDVDIADTGYDTLNVSIETVELLGATPKQFEKKVAVNQTFAATGTQDVDLPVGNMVRGMLLWGTTGFTGASPAPSWGRLKLLLNATEYGYSSTDWEVLQSVANLWGRSTPPYDDHRHIVTTDGNAQTELGTLAGVQKVGSSGWQNYALMDLDPTRDDTYTVDTRGANRFQIRAEAETADAVRCVPIEIVPVSSLL